MNADIISIGTELLLGDIIDTNAAFISRALAGIGVDVYRRATVGDNPERLRAAMKDALGRADVVIASGGLGPTIDDVTMETVAKLAGMPLIEHKGVLKDLHNYFRFRKLKTPRETLRQALVPEGAKIVRNKVGSAPGVIIEIRNRSIICLPGPPRELEPMFMNDVIPYLKKKFGVGWILRSRTIKLTGLAESQVNGKVADLLVTKPPTTVGIYAKPGQVELKIMSKAKSESGAARAIGKIEAKIRKRLGKYIFGADDETLESAVVGLLAKKKLTLAIAESCTGGLISSRVTDIPGSSHYFIDGVITYSNASKEWMLGVKRSTLARFGAVSKEAALEMACGVRSLSSSDVGLAVTGIAGPSTGSGPVPSLPRDGPGGAAARKPVGLVYIALATHGKSIVREFRFRGSRAEVKWQAAQGALELLRRHLKGD